MHKCTCAFPCGGTECGLPTEKSVLTYSELHAKFVAAQLEIAELKERLCQEEQKSKVLHKGDRVF